MNEQSAEIGELATALSKAQGQITGALKDSSNPFFKSKYADLASCWDACRKQLSENGLAVIQTTCFAFQQGCNDPVLVTTLTHSSGQWIRGCLPIKAKDDGPQAQGSGITYARRYALAAIVGLAQIDDDAEAATDRGNEKKRPDTKQINDYSTRITKAVGDDNIPLLRELIGEAKFNADFWASVWSTLGKPIKDYIQTHIPKDA